VDVLVTGGSGFLGKRVVVKLLERGTVTIHGDDTADIDNLIVVDVVPPADSLAGDPRVRFVEADFALPDAFAPLITPNVGVVFHLGAAVSAECERDFDLGLQVNLMSTHRLLEACRHRAEQPRLVFTSSVAAYGGELPAVIGDDTPLTPQTSYGTQKGIGELLINDYSRKGFIDGRCLRLPTVIVRPGRPNQAASSFASAVIREPLQGEEYTCPVRPDTAMYVLSTRRAVAALVHAADLPVAAWGTNRSVCLPGITVTVGELVDALRDIAGDAIADGIRFQPDRFIEQIVHGWPVRFAPQRGLRMGFQADNSIHEIIHAFIGDELQEREIAGGENDKKYSTP
jgi:nucleoside-diphosphate-sugar epimerase